MNNSIIYNLSILDLQKFNTPRMDISYYYGSVCNQLNRYFIKVGLMLIILYVVIHWFNWWFFNYGYKKFDDFICLHLLGVRKFIGDLNCMDTRIYWDVWIKTRLMKLLIGYITIVVYLNLRK